MDHEALHRLVLSAQRRRLRIARRRLGPREDRPDRTPEELIAYLRSKQVTSTRDLKRKRAPGDPTVYDIAKRFGSFSVAMTQAFGPRKPPTADPPNDPGYMIRCVINFGLRTYRQYLRARRLRPDIIPSVHQVRRVFRNYDNLTYIAERLSLKGNLSRYLALRRSLGRRPTFGECQDANIDLAAAVKVIGNTWAVDRFAQDCIEAGERQQVETAEVHAVANSA